MFGPFPYQNVQRKMFRYTSILPLPSMDGWMDGWDIYRNESMVGGGGVCYYSLSIIYHKVILYTQKHINTVWVSH